MMDVGAWAGLAANAIVAAVGGMAALWSHQSRDMVKSLDHRLSAVEQVLMRGVK